MIGRIADVIVGLNADHEDTPHAFLGGLVLLLLPALVVIVLMWTHSGPVAALGAMAVGGLLFAFGGLFMRWVDYCNPDDDGDPR